MEVRSQSRGGLPPLLLTCHPSDAEAAPIAGLMSADAQARQRHPAASAGGWRARAAPACSSKGQSIDIQNHRKPECKCRQRQVYQTSVVRHFKYVPSSWTASPAVNDRPSSVQLSGLPSAQRQAEGVGRRGRKAVRKSPHSKSRQQCLGARRVRGRVVVVNNHEPID